MNHCVVSSIIFAPPCNIFYYLRTPSNILYICIKSILNILFSIPFGKVLFQYGSQETNASPFTIVEDRSQDFTAKELPEAQKLPPGNSVQYVHAVNNGLDESHEIRKKDHVEVDRYDDDVEDFIDEPSETEGIQPVVEIDNDDNEDDGNDVKGEGKLSTRTLGSGEKPGKMNEVRAILN